MLIIAGIDSSGGAGIHADIRTCHDIGVEPFTAVTAITVQNKEAVSGVFPVSPEFIIQQIKSAGDGQNVKIGMLYNAQNINIIADYFTNHVQKTHIVLDPIIRATSGDLLMQEDAINSLTDKLFPLTKLITPNIPEAELLANCTIHNIDDMYKAADILLNKYNLNAVLIKAGHMQMDNDGNLNDILVNKDNKSLQLTHKYLKIDNVRGTGCTYSSAITAYIERGYILFEAVEKAHKYMQDYLRQ